jgi:hypothetical protein
MCGQYWLDWNTLSKAAIVAKFCGQHMEDILDATVSDPWSNYLWPFYETHGRLVLLRTLMVIHGL